MNCETAQAEIIDAVTEGKSPQSDAVINHLSSCERCRRAASELEVLWTRLGELDVPSLSQDRAKQLREQVLAAWTSTPNVAPRPRRKLPPPLVAAAAMIVGIVIGAVLSRSRPALTMFPVDVTERIPLPITGPGGGRFLFMLHRPDGVLPEGRGARYQQWADDLQARNLLVEAGALGSSGGWMLTGRGDSLNATPLPAGVIEGFFLIAAPDSAAVVNAARISPHFDYGGAIEVRRVVN